jgi:hypothetical protein
MIPPPAQHFMSERAGSTVVEEKGSHAIYISKPEVVAALIDKAASNCSSSSARVTSLSLCRASPSACANSRSPVRLEFPGYPLQI